MSECSASIRLYPRYRFLQQRTFLNPDYDASYTVPGVEVEYLQYGALPVVSRVMNGYNCGRILTPCVRKFRPDVIIGYFLYPVGFAPSLPRENSNSRSSSVRSAPISAGSAAS